jgi:phosphoribosylformylglycinamidine synthase subunit PurL
MQEPKITEQLIQEHGINSEEYTRILDTLKREPTFTELGIISVMWSEHASYKNSIRLLKTLPKEGASILAKAGEENAGVVDIGDGLAVSFKIESHNHPSAVEPYHGAATGVGGILRDIFTMGARPVAVLDSLRFGNPDDPQVKHLIREVVNGIADYGNCFGVPTVGGEVYFEDSYEGNPLVNAMAVGILKHGDLAKSAAKGVGNLVVYVGAKTGRDGIHGATFASVELTEESEEKRTAVQVGDPFMEKLLLEATLEVIQQGLVVAIQDMGAAGLTCSSSEMAGKTDVGIELDVAKVPKRETGMSSYEIMLSESQERMLIIVDPAKFKQLEAIFHKWDLSAVVIGKVTDDGFLRVLEDGVIQAELPARMLVLGGDAPVYFRETQRPAYLDTVHQFKIEDIPEPKDYNQVLKKLISSANLASKRPIFRQYDHMVQVNTMVEPGSDAAVVHVNGTRKALAMATDCNGRHCYLDPYEGTKGAVAEAARNVACSGAKPVAITNCLNFGNPYKPEVYWTFSEAIRGMSDACRAFDTPVTGGNVSFYNENPKGAIYPTPTIGMLGLISDIDHILTQEFKNVDDIIILLGKRKNEIGGSEYLKTIHGLVAGYPPQVDLEEEAKLQKLILSLNQEGLLMSAHDCSDGGLVVCIVESCLKQDGTILGAEIHFNPIHRTDVEYFGESHGRVVISVNPSNIELLENMIKKSGYPYQIIGKVISSNLMIDNNIFIPVEDIKQLWEKSLPI